MIDRTLENALGHRRQAWGGTSYSLLCWIDSGTYIQGPFFIVSSRIQTLFLRIYKVYCTAAVVRDPGTTYHISVSELMMLYSYACCMICYDMNALRQVHAAVEIHIYHYAPSQLSWNRWLPCTICGFFRVLAWQTREENARPPTVGTYLRCLRQIRQIPVYLCIQIPPLGTLACSGLGRGSIRVNTTPTSSHSYRRILQKIDKPHLLAFRFGSMIHRVQLLARLLIRIVCTTAAFMYSKSIRTGGYFLLTYVCTVSRSLTLAHLFGSTI